MDTRGGVASFVRTMASTPLWSEWDVKHVATHRNGSTVKKIGVFVLGALQFMVALVSYRPGVVHLHTSFDGSFVRKATLLWVATLFRVPTVMHVHGSDFDRFYERSPRPLKWWIRTTMEHASVVVALGDRWVGILGEMAPAARIVSVPNAIHPRIAVVQPRDGDPVEVLFLGEVGDRKGTFTLIDAWAALVANHGGAVPARLTIAGDGEVDRARAAVAHHDLDTSVTVLGWIARDEVPALLTGSQVLVLPSRHEGQPMAILEAMANGLAIIAGNVGGIGDLIDSECGILLAPDDVPALESALKRVIFDPAERARLGERALERVRAEFDVDVVWRRFDTMYEEIAR